MILRLFALFALMSVLHAESWQPGPGWQLVWSDEFDGVELNRKNWTFDLGATGWGNNERQNYTSERTNIFLVNGELVIRAVKNGTNYSSARIKTLGLQSWAYGKMAARIKLPYGQGIWPAFWMMGTNVNLAGWPGCGEIDIMEMIGGGRGRDDTIYGTIHWQEKGKHTSKGSGEYAVGKPLHEDYHVFEIEWTPASIIWKFDGAKYFEAPIDPKNQPGTASFQKAFFLLLNLAVGGNWPGMPNAHTVFPQEMRVDWVRVYRSDPK
jgi:beta-glucanase (GH16 family)